MTISGTPVSMIIDWRFRSACVSRVWLSASSPSCTSAKMRERSAAFSSTRSTMVRV
jgi:hypothetical protein